MSCTDVPGGSFEVLESHFFTWRFPSLKSEEKLYVKLWTNLGNAEIRLRLQLGHVPTVIFGGMVKLFYKCAPLPGHLSLWLCSFCAEVAWWHYRKLSLSYICWTVFWYGVNRGTLWGIKWYWEINTVFPPQENSAKRKHNKSSRHMYTSIKQSANETVLKERDWHSNTNFIDSLELVNYSQSLSQADNLYSSTEACWVGMTQES